MTDITEIELAPGETFKFASPCLDEENCEFLAMAFSDDVPLKEFLRAFVRTARKSLAENHSPEEIERAMGLIRFQQKTDSNFRKVIRALTAADTLENIDV